MNQISVTVNTGDTETLEEVGAMFTRLSGRAAVLPAPKPCSCPPATTGEEILEGMETLQGVTIHDDLAPLPAAAPPVTEPPAALATSPGIDETAKAEALGEAVGQAMKGIIDVVAPAAAAPPIIDGSATSAAAPPITTGVELDGEGISWDPRIHVSTKTTRQSDKTWKLQRNIDPVLVESVKAELRAAMSAPVAAAPPVAAAAPPVTEQTVAAGPTTFPELLMAYTAHQTAGKISNEEMDSICQAQGLPSLPLVASRPDLIPAINEDMEAICLTRG